MSGFGAISGLRGFGAIAGGPFIKQTLDASLFETGLVTGFQALLPTLFSRLIVRCSCRTTRFF